MTPERRQLYQQLFNDADANKDGVLQLQELGSLMKRLGFRGNDDELKKMFGNLDKNQDERVSCDELLTFLSSYSNRELFEADLRAAFRRYDRDSNGTISKEELRLGLKEQGANWTDVQLDNAISKADKNKDGVVDYEEFLALVRTINK